MKRAFVQSVGTGTRADSDITRLLVWSIRESHPDRIVWVVSRDSRRFADQLVAELNVSEEQYEIAELSSISNVEAIYRECRAVLRSLEQHGFTSDDIEVDYTSGTKAMTAGLVLAAATHHCGRLKYITGEYDSGIVVGRTEKEERIQPRKIWADEQIYTALNLCRALRFDAASDLLKTIQPEWLGDYERGLVLGLTHVAHGYGAWDRFDYGRAKGELEKLLSLDVHELADFRPDASVLSRIVHLKTPHDVSAEAMPSLLGPDRLADVFNNAQRRLAEGRDDDALARLYRLTEMLAQWILFQDYGVMTGNVDLSKVPEAFRSALDAQRNREGKIQIGLDWDYQLLKAFEHRIGVAFSQERPIGVLLKKRNDSLLAHGVAPIQRQDVDSLVRKLGELLRVEIPDFESRCYALEFPWRRSRRPGA